MLKLISPIYYWKDIILDISNFVKCCETCQLNKKSTQKKKYGLLQEVPVAEEPFEMISLDTVGGFNYHNSQKKYLHIVLDHATRYAWTFPSKSVTSEIYTNCLKQIFSIQCPKQLLSDRNAAFTSSKFKKFLKHHNIRQLLTSANRPQCNGKNERVNQTLVAKLRCKVNSTTKTPWTKLLEQVTYEYNNSPHDVTGFPPAYLMFGTLPYDSPLPNQVKLNYPPIQQARQIAVNRTIKHHKINKQRYDKHYVDAKFKVGDLVLYQNFSYPNSSKLQSPYNGPFKVVRKLSNVTYEIDKPNQYTGKLTDIVHSTRLKPFHSKSISSYAKFLFIFVIEFVFSNIGGEEVHCNFKRSALLLK
ncbi:transposon Tf2-11 polyprotein [Trichonephila clavipes]|nr:transposon Tf2-11 polyprotein [Trichonephila clavipes]